MFPRESVVSVQMVARGYLASSWLLVYRHKTMQPTTTMGPTMRAASRNGFGPGIGPRISINTITLTSELEEYDIVSFSICWKSVSVPQAYRL